VEYLNEHEKFLFEEDGMNISGEGNMDAGGGEPVDDVMPESPDNMMEAADDPFHNFAHVIEPVDINRAKAIMGANGYLIKIGPDFFVSGPNPQRDPLYPIDQKVVSQFGNNLKVVKDNPNSVYKPWKIMKVTSGIEPTDINKGMKKIRPVVGNEYHTFESKGKKVKESYNDMTDEELQAEHDKHNADKEDYDGNKTNPNYPKFKKAVNTQKQIKNVQRNRDKAAGKIPHGDPTLNPAKDRANRNKPWEEKFDRDLFIEKAIQRGLNREQIKSLLKEVDYNSNEEPVEEYKDLTNQLIEELTDENDHSAVDVIKAMLITRDVKMFKVAAAKWIKREEQGYL
jgi:hypothetical protein